VNARPLPHDGPAKAAGPARRAGTLATLDPKPRLILELVAAARSQHEIANLLRGRSPTDVPRWIRKAQRKIDAKLPIVREWLFGEPVNVQRPP